MEETHEVSFLVMIPGVIVKDDLNDTASLNSIDVPTFGVDLDSEPVSMPIFDSLVVTGIADDDDDEGDDKDDTYDLSAVMESPLSSSPSVSPCSSHAASDCSYPSPSESSNSSECPSPSASESSNPPASEPSSSSSPPTFPTCDDQMWKPQEAITTQISELSRLLRELDDAGQPDTPPALDHGSPVKPVTKPLKSCLKKHSSVGTNAIKDDTKPMKKVHFDTIDNHMNVEDGAIRVSMITYIPTPESSPEKESPGIKKSASPWRGGSRAAARRCLEETLDDESVVVEYQDLDGLAFADFIDYQLDIRHLINFFGSG